MPGYCEDVSQGMIKVGYGYEMTGIVKALDGGYYLQTIAPDDSEHSPVSGKWQLYVISVTETQSPVRLGDVNDDGLINLKDLSDLISYLLGAEPHPFNRVNADITGNGIAIDDMSALINILLTQK